MPSLTIENVPQSLFNQIQRLAEARQRTPADAALEVLETAFQTTKATFSEPPLPSEIFLSDEMCAPCEIPWPEGESVVPIEVSKYVPEPHDIPDGE